jgi:KUP system potassium uptake protein
VIASQALITAAFSVTKQVIQLGYLPRLRITHTSIREAGQIYVPFVNWSLFACIVVAVVLFRSSGALASAYGIAVTIDMTITTVMTFFVVRWGWRLPLSLCLAATGFFFVVDLVFFAANAVKVLEGGWFPLLIGAAMFTLMTTWARGRMLLAERLRSDAIDLPAFLEAIFVSPPVRVPGTAVFLNAERGSTPFALLHNLKHNKVLHEQNLFVTVQHHEVPWIGFDRRVEVEPLGHDCWQVTLHFGFKNDPDVPEALKLLGGRGIELRRHGDELLPQPRLRHPHLRAGHGAVAREALCQHAPQRGCRGGLPLPAGQPHRRARLEGRDLSPPAGTRARPVQQCRPAKENR